MFDYEFTAQDAQLAVQKIQNNFTANPGELLGYVEKSIYPFAYFDKGTGSRRELRGPVNIVGAHLNHFARLAGVPLMFGGQVIEAQEYKWVSAKSFQNIADVVAAFRAKFPKA